MPCLQDAQLTWLHRVQTALRGIAAHEVNFATMPEASSSAQLTQAWQTFKQTVHADSQPTASAALVAAASTIADLPHDPALAADATSAVLTVTAEATGNVVASSAQMASAAPVANGFAHPGQASAVVPHNTAATDALLGRGQRSASIAGAHGSAPTTLVTSGAEADVVGDDDEEVWLQQLVVSPADHTCPASCFYGKPDSAHAVPSQWAASHSTARQPVPYALRRDSTHCACHKHNPLQHKQVKHL